MDEPSDASAHALRKIVFETMLLGRHLAPANQHEDGERYLDRSAYTLLSRLGLGEPMSIGQLSDAFGLDASTLNRQTAAMMRKGLVRRIPDPDGGMARKFVMTSAGRERLDRERRTKLAGLAEVLSDWSAADVATLAALLRRFNGDIERREGRTWPRPD